MTVELQFHDASIHVRCVALTGEERLGEATRLEATVFSTTRLSASSLLGQPCGLLLESPFGSRAIAGIVTRVATIAQGAGERERAYRIGVEARVAQLALRTRSRVYQKMTGAEIVAKVLKEGGYPEKAIVRKLHDPLPARDYSVQYGETDAAFVRRVCEEDGLYFFSGVSDDGETITITDESTQADAVLDLPLPVVGDIGQTTTSTAAAFHWRAKRSARTGKVTLRDYDHERPSHTLEGVVSEGEPVEKGLEVYEAPGEFRSAKEGERRAAIRLGALRSESHTVSFRSTSLKLAPGGWFAVDPQIDLRGTKMGDELLVVAVRHDWQRDRGDTHDVDVLCVPHTTRHRLAARTPRPHLSGLDSALVTGAAGAEVHPDELGRVFVRFLWDLDGERDHKSSLPVRVTQPHTKGPQHLPRIGWEVLVGFEDGDPDLPYVMGKSFNGKQTPPFALPANKTVTSYATDSSPGGKSRSSFHIDDAAGRQHMKFQAPSFKHAKAAAKMDLQTGKNEKHSVTGSQSLKVLGAESVSVGQAFFETLGSQSITVGGLHKLSTTGDQQISVGTEVSIVVGGVVEQVGNPYTGAVNCAKAAVISGVSSLGVWGAVAGAGLGIANSAEQGFEKHGADGALEGGVMAAVGIGASFIPGGDAVLASVTGASHPNAWDFGNPGSGSAAPGGGAGGGASDASAAGGPGPGYRQVLAKAGGAELVGALAVVTPGRIGWTTTGGALVATGSNRKVEALSVVTRVGGLSGEVVGSLDISASKMTRKSALASTMNAGSSLAQKGAEIGIKAPVLKLNVKGALEATTSHLFFAVPGASVHCNNGSLEIVASAEIEITGEFSASDLYHA